MEIFQTIWNALTTENIMLLRILAIPMTVVEVLVTTLLFTTILNIESTKKQKIVYVSIFSIIAIISSQFIPTPFNTFINVIACPILVYFIFKANLLKSVLAEIIPYIFFVILGSLFINIYTIVSGIPTSQLQTIPIHKILFSSLLYIFAYLIYLFIKKNNLYLSMSDLKNRKDNIVLLFNLLVGILAIFIQSYLATFYTNYLPFYITVTSVLVILIYFLISIYSLSRTVKLEKTTENLEEEKLYNKTLTILYDNIRVFKHDFNNIVQSIGGYISTNNMEGLKDFYSDLMDDCKKINNLAVLNPELINNPAVYSLLTSKYHKAEGLGIKMNFEIFLNLDGLNIKTYNLTRILGILLDNAIEASSKSDEKEIHITIRKDNKVNRDLFIIENTYSNKNIDTNRIFEKGYTSKIEDDGKSHGLGLWEVRQILSKNNNLNLFTTKSNRLFKQQLEIYK